MLLLLPVFITRAFVGAVAMMTVALAYAQAQSSKPTAPQTPKESTRDEDFSKWNPETLLRERDTLTQSTNDISFQITWINDAIAKCATRAQLEQLQKPTQD